MKLYKIFITYKKKKKENNFNFSYSLLKVCIGVFFP